jgi:phospholipid transport system substrate-binding protein
VSRGYVPVPHRAVVAVLALTALVCSVGNTIGRAAEGPSAAVQETADAVVAVLADKSLNAEQRRRKVEEIVYAHFDFETLSRLVLARNWKELTPDQQKAFVEEFKRHLSVTYGKNVETYNNEKAVVTGDRAEARDDWTVKTKIVRPNADAILVDYRLRQEGGEWRVIDVVIEGVSLVANFRAQFQEIISRDGAAKLIELLREKNAKGESLKS